MSYPEDVEMEDTHVSSPSELSGVFLGRYLSSMLERYI